LPWPSTFAVPIDEPPAITLTWAPAWAVPEITRIGVPDPSTDLTTPAKTGTYAVVSMVTFWVAGWLETFLAASLATNVKT